MDRILEYLGFGQAKLCFEVELLFLVETFQDSVHLLAFLHDMKWVPWVTSSYHSVSIWASRFVGCSLVLTFSQEQRVICFVEPLFRDLNPTA